MKRAFMIALVTTSVLGCGSGSSSGDGDADTATTDAVDLAGDVLDDEPAQDPRPDETDDVLEDSPADLGTDTLADPVFDLAADSLVDTDGDFAEDPIPDPGEDAAEDPSPDSPVDAADDPAMDPAGDPGFDPVEDAPTEEIFSCPAGETDCGGFCADLGSDDEHCGHCDIECLFDEQCVSSTCQIMPWRTVGRAVNMGLDPAIAHAISTDGAAPYVAMVLSDLSWQGDVRVRRFQDLPLGWTAGGPSLLPMDLDARPVVDIQFAGSTPYVAHHNGTLARLRFFDGTIWDEVGAPGFTTMCMGLEGLRFVLAGTEPHVTYMGAGGCGLGVGYFFYDAGGWQHHPSTTGFPGTELVTMNGNGVSDLAFTDRAYVLTGDTASHSVKVWDASGSGWIDHGSTLEMNTDTGWHEDHAMATDAAGDLYVAWSEQDAVGDGSIYVKTYATGWALLGDDAASGGGHATRPSIAIIGGVAWIAYQENDGSSEKVMVRRWSGTTWERVGLPLNVSLSEDGLWPDIVGIGGVPFVAFRESDGSGLCVYVKTFP